MRRILTQVLFLAFGASLSAQMNPLCPVNCPVASPQAGKAWCNQPGAPLKKAAYDFVPTDAVGRGFHVVYSHKDVPVPNNAGIFVFQLDPATSGRNRVLVFGSGYGDVPTATYSSRCDARFTDHVIQNELNLTPNETTIQFVAPHGHFDHINPEFLRNLGHLGYRIGKIRFHQLDWNLMEPNACGCVGGFCPDPAIYYEYLGAPEIKDMAWSPPTGPIGGPCFTDLLSNLTPGDTDYFDTQLTFTSPLGIIRFKTTPGHTCGTVDLFVDTGSDYIRVRGSKENGPLPTWVSDPLLYDIRPHGNLDSNIIPDVLGLSCP